MATKKQTAPAAADKQPAATKAKAKATRAPKLRVVVAPFVLHWPIRSGNPPTRGLAGTRVAENDPLLDTTKLTDEQIRSLRLTREDQTFKTRPATAAEAKLGPTPYSWTRASRIYAELDYDGIRHVQPHELEEAKAAAPERARPRTKTSVTVPPLVD